MTREERLQEIGAALEIAQAAQTAFWDAMSELETALGGELEDFDNQDLALFDAKSILEEFEVQHEGEDEEEEEEDTCPSTK